MLQFYKLMLSFIILPLLLSGFLMLVFGNAIGLRGSIIIAISSCILSTLGSFINFIEVNLKNQQSILLIYNWFSINNLQINFELQNNSYNCIMSLMVTSITSCVLIFTCAYMIADPHLIRFYSYLCLFAGFMLLLIYSNNLVLLLIGWEGIGIVSFQLIGFWFSRLDASQSALKAIIVNKISDVFLILSTGIMWWLFGSTNLNLIFMIENNKYIMLLSFLLLIGCMAKSALFLLHVWLADAMEGPTPVSALIHAATLVTAGVLVLTKCSHILSLDCINKYFILIIGSLTALTSAMTGLAQTDIKRTIAFSTCSQLGYMIVAIGLSQPTIALYHTITHAYFKAGLFLVAGSIIASSNGQQDYRLAGSIHIISWISVAVSIVVTSLCGSFFTAGYYSKDLIIEHGTTILDPLSTWSIYILLVGVLLTSWYSTELQLVNIIYKINTSLSTIYNTSSSLFFIVPVFILSICSLWCGFLLEDGLAMDKLHLGSTQSEFIAFVISLLPILCVFLGSYLCLNNQSTNIFISIWLNSRLGFDWLYNKIISFSLLNSSYIIYLIIENGVFEYTTVNTINKILNIVNFIILKTTKQPFKQSLVIIVVLVWLLITF